MNDIYPLAPEGEELIAGKTYSTPNGGTFMPLVPGIQVSGYVEIVVPEGADSAQLTALYRQAHSAAELGTRHTPNSNECL